jgi:hypothetical protein
VFDRQMDFLLRFEAGGTGTQFSARLSLNHLLVVFDLFCHSVRLRKLCCLIGL